jgi:hypothetical protein
MTVRLWGFKGIPLDPSGEPTTLIGVIVGYYILLTGFPVAAFFLFGLSPARKTA